MLHYTGIMLSMQHTNIIYFILFTNKYGSKHNKKSELMLIRSATASV